MTDIARADIRPAFAERNIPVAFVTDANKLPYVGVAVNSVVANATGRNLDILILHSGIGDEAPRDFVARYAGHKNVSIRFVNVSEAQGAFMLADFTQVSRLPVPACYRLLLSDILTAYDKLLYLDVDIVVCRDVAELYATDLGGNLFGGIFDRSIRGIVRRRPEYAALSAKFGFSDWDRYINTGVLLINLDALRGSGMTHELIRAAVESSAHFCDQDAINFLCRERILHLPPKWNFLTLPTAIAEQQAALAGESPAIVHYVGGAKPWNRPETPFGNFWWNHIPVKDGVALWRTMFGVPEASSPCGEGVAVSVIVPVYNAEPYLAQMLVSLAAQTREDIEIICVDDGSTDGSRAICERFATADRRFRIISQKNSGGAIARNRGIDDAKGKWLFFADADDFCRPDMLAEMVASGEGCEADIVIAGHYVIDTRSAQQMKVQKVLQSNLLHEGAVNCATDGVNVFSGSCTVIWNKLFLRDFVVGNGIRFHQTPPSDDVYFSLVSLLQARRLRFVDRSYYYYRRFLPTSQMGREEAQSPTNFLKAFLEVKEFLEGCESKLQIQFFKVAVAVCFMNLARRKTIEGARKTYFALRDGGIRALQFRAVDDQAIDMGNLRKLYDLTKAGADLDEVLLSYYSARCDNVESTIERVHKEANELRELVANRDGMLVKRDASIVIYRKRIAELEENLCGRDTELAAINRDICHLRKQLAARNAILSKIEDCVKGATKSN